MTSLQYQKRQESLRKRMTFLRAANEPDHNIEPDHQSKAELKNTKYEHDVYARRFPRETYPGRGKPSDRAAERIQFSRPLLMRRQKKGKLRYRSIRRTQLSTRRVFRGSSSIAFASAQNWDIEHISSSTKGLDNPISFIIGAA